MAAARKKKTKTDMKLIFMGGDRQQIKQVSI
jgi:hypothetical protein